VGHSVKRSGHSAVFGRRKEPHTVVIARGDEIRHFTVRPWLAALAGSALSAVAIGYLLATTYLVLRDDLIGAATARQARIQQAYEDRISALRAQVDRITSRQLLDQQLMESKVSELLERQSVLSERHGRLEPILERRDEEGKLLPSTVPVPEKKPDIRASLFDDGFALPVQASDSTPQPFAFWSTRDALKTETTTDHADRLFIEINRSLRAIEKEQLGRIASLAENAYQTVDAISDALETAGLSVDRDFGKQGAGGPLVAVDASSMFETKVKELDEALGALDTVKAKARKLPIGNPAPGHSISSSFGIRSDPILRMPAFHSGMDFIASAGFPIRATAPGTVSVAGRNGGYGRMVEVDHGNGFSTRYAHMSRIRVKIGQKIAAGDIVGDVGSTGRSTGPHLHYEVRRNGEAVDPLRFLKAGKKIERLL
jgi:murein DD-endopeptidase MepM/ murein hydrolase activator NlpD